MTDKILPDTMERFLERFLNLPAGYRSVSVDGKRYGLSIESSSDGKRRKLYAEELGGNDHVSFNLYLLDGKDPLLKPCEMPAQKVIDFVLSFQEIESADG